MEQTGSAFSGMIHTCGGSSFQGNVSAAGGPVSINFQTLKSDSEAGLKRERECRQAFSVDYESPYRNIPPRYPRTCEWFSYHPEYVKWMQDDKPTPLWISDNPGIGKTVLAKFLVEKLTESSRKVIYFFCSNQDENRMKDISILKALIHQCLQFVPALLTKYVMPHYEAHGDKICSSVGRLWNIFEKITGDPELEGLYCVHDALDECDEESRTRLLGEIRRNFQSILTKESGQNGQMNLKLVFTSRLYDSIQSQLPVTIIRLKAEREEESINKDIAAFTDDEVQKLAIYRHYTDDLRLKVRDALLARANGMFLWVSLMIKVLQNASPRQVDEKLKVLPKRVEDIYNQILQEIPENSEDIVSSILKWVVFEFRPLTLTELGIACGIRQEYKSASSIPPEILYCIEGDMGLCGCILKVQDQGFVHLVHQTTKEFLLRSRLSSPQIFRFILLETVAHFQIAMACVTYLSFREMERGPLIGLSKWWYHKEYLALLREHPLLEYAAVYWYQHVHQTGEQSKELWGAVRNSLTVSPKRELSFQVHRFSNAHHYSGNQTPLHILTRTGLTYLVAISLASESIELETKDDNGQTALQMASQEGHEAVVQLLLEKGADANAEEEEEYWWTTRKRVRRALHTAAERGHKVVARLLLEKGADVNAEAEEAEEYWRSKRIMTALHLVAKKGHEAVVRLLLEKGADVNAETEERFWEAKRTMTALHLAAKKGHETVVQLLIEKGADVNTEEKEQEEGRYGGNKNTRTQTALHLAAKRGHETVVQLLLEKGADINGEERLEKEGFWGIKTTMTALHLAAREGHEAVVQLLTPFTSEPWLNRPRPPHPPPL